MIENKLRSSIDGLGGNTDDGGPLMDNGWVRNREIDAVGNIEFSWVDFSLSESNPPTDPAAKNKEFWKMGRLTSNTTGDCRLNFTVETQVEGDSSNSDVQVVGYAVETGGTIMYTNFYNNEHNNWESKHVYADTYSGIRTEEATNARWGLKLNGGVTQSENTGRLHNKIFGGNDSYLYSESSGAGYGAEMKCRSQIMSLNEGDNVYVLFGIDAYRAKYFTVTLTYETD
jgi:hypothetical protein